MAASSALSRAQQVLQQVADIPPGPAVRFDYQNLDVEHSRLYIAHMNADQLVVFDTQKRQVVANQTCAWRYRSAGDKLGLCLGDG
jgi:hypothetical protein